MNTFLDAVATTAGIIVGLWVALFIISVILRLKTGRYRKVRISEQWLDGFVRRGHTRFMLDGEMVEARVDLSRTDDPVISVADLRNIIKAAK